MATNCDYWCDLEEWSIGHPDPMKAVADLARCLNEAVGIIQIFHGPAGWELYRDQAPEMKMIRAALEPFDAMLHRPAWPPRMGARPGNGIGVFGPGRSTPDEGWTGPPEVSNEETDLQLSA